MTPKAYYTSELPDELAEAIQNAEYGPETPALRAPTKETYTELDRAYDLFNAELFEGRLPPCIIVMQRKRGARGYFWGSTWTDAGGQVVTDEIALNPDHFRDRTPEEVLSTLAHEMCHLEQHHFGSPSRTGYHNREWAGMMERIGLTPSDTGKPGGKKTGQRVTHYIAEGGPFARITAELIASGFTIPWLARTKSEIEVKRAKKKTASKTKYTCPGCGLNAWAKPGARLTCGDCEQALAP